MSNEANIFVLVDALGWEWIKDSEFLEDVAPYRRRLESVLGYSTAAIPSILTGRYPDQHGRVALFRRALGRSPFQSLAWLCRLPPAVVENSYARYAVKLLARKANHFDGWFHLLGVPLRHLPMLDVSEKRNIYLPGGIPEATSIFDLLARSSVGYGAYTYWQGSNQELLSRVELDLAKAEKSFFFLYLDGLDSFLHGHADEPCVVKSKLKFYSDALGHLYRVALSAYRTVRIHVFGDHGMAPTRNAIDVQNRLEGLRSRAPEDYLYVLDSTMARFWFFDDRARGEILGDLFRGEDGGRWLGETELRSLHAWFDDCRYGEAIYLMPEGSVIVSHSPGEVIPHGMHGYHPSTAHSFSAFLSSRDYGNRLQRIVDIFGLMAEYC